MVPYFHPSRKKIKDNLDKKTECREELIPRKGSGLLVSLKSGTRDTKTE